MPELPEVESVVVSLKKLVLGQVVKNIEFAADAKKLALPYSFSEINDLLRGEEFQEITRRGKYIIIKTTTKVIVVHLRMTGRFSYQSNIIGDFYYASVREKYFRVGFEFDKGRLDFYDKRKFATIEIMQKNADTHRFENLGPDAIDVAFHSDYFARQLGKRKKSIYSVLMDQAIVAGIGNIYACEILFVSRIHPSTPAFKLVPKSSKIVETIKEILQIAIANKGTSFSDYVDATGAKGNYTDSLKVYGQKEVHFEGRKYEVKKLKISGRSVYFAPDLQEY